MRVKGLDMIQSLGFRFTVEGVGFRVSGLSSRRGFLG